jgi:hypothetical protein
MPQLNGTHDIVFVTMRLQHMGDLHRRLSRSIHIDLAVAAWINDHCLIPITDQVRIVRQSIRLNPLD